MKGWKRWMLMGVTAAVIGIALSHLPLTSTERDAKTIAGQCMQHGQVKCPPDYVVDDVTAGANQVIQVLRSEGRLPR